MVDRCEPHRCIEKLINSEKYYNELINLYKYAYKDYPEYQDKNLNKYINYLINNSIIFVYKINNKIIGLIAIEENKFEGEISEFVVDCDFHGLGIGKDLFKKGLSYLSNKDISLEVGKFNKPALNMYKKYGFKELKYDGKWIEMKLVKNKKKVA